MPRAIATQFLADFEALNAQDMEIVLLTISYPTFTVRFARDVVNYVWRGETYFGAMFDLEFVSDDENEPHGTLRVPNVDRRIGESILAISSPPQLRIDVLGLSDFDFPFNFVSGGGFGAVGEYAIGESTLTVGPTVIEEEPAFTCRDALVSAAEPMITADFLYLKNVRCTAVALEADIIAWELSAEPFPGIRATKGRLPGLYR
jgi:hypothetical protein